MTTNRATFLQGRWQFSEDKANVKVLVRIWSVATSAMYGRQITPLEACEHLL